MKRLLFYCQHVLGMGHLMRSRALVAGLVEQFEVCFLNGGESVPGFEFASAVEVINLPALTADESFKVLASHDGQDLAEVQSQRRQQILAAYERFQPDIVVIELFPFGRKKLATELGSLLVRIRLDGRNTQVVCSLRDILVQRPDQSRYEAQVCDTLNRYFDLLLIHADPNFQQLAETFGAVANIQIPILYTGYVAQQPTHPTPSAVLPSQCQPPIVLASIGGGRVGVELLIAAAKASILLHNAWPHQLLLFSGPYLPDEHFVQLAQLVADHPHITLDRYTTDFVALMSQATLSISMAGYNTCMNVLTTGVRALVLPFTGGNNDEQTLRAQKLAALGVLDVLQKEDLQPERMAQRIGLALQKSPSANHLELNGVEKTTHLLSDLVAQTTRSRRQVPFQKILVRSNPDSATLPAFLYPLRQALAQVAAQGRTLDLFLRDDDIDCDEETLRHLLDITLLHDTPITLAVIPGLLTADGIARLKIHKKLFPQLIELHQHGWQHLNHEPTGRKCEFGNQRSFEQQLADIGQGKARLEEIFEDKFFPAFTPPWNRCTPETLAVLDHLNFAVFSRSWQPEPLAAHRCREISITLDLMQWKNGGELRSPTAIVDQFVEQTQQCRPIGLLLHHKVMGQAAFDLFDQLLAEVRRHPCVRIQTLQTALSIPNAS